MYMYYYRIMMHVQVLSAATVIAKHTSSLCNACRVASSKTSEPQAKRHFVQAAKDVANSTAALVKEIKALDADYSEVSAHYNYLQPFNCHGRIYNVFDTYPISLRIDSSR
jgi:hypothetical protein